MRNIPVLLRGGGELDRNLARLTDSLVQKLAGVESITWIDDEGPASALAVVGELEVRVPMAGLIDKDAEMARLAKEKTRLEGDIKRTAGKLGNASFVDKAPAAVVDKERSKLAESEATLARIALQIEKLNTL